LPDAARPSVRAARASIVALGLASALILLASTVAPVLTLGATSTKAAACGANLRNTPYTTGKLRTTIKTNTRVTVAATVSGGSWRLTCAGRTISARSWYRISAISGQSVKYRFGVSYLYAATGLFKSVSTTAPATSPTPPPPPPPAPAGSRPFAAPVTTRTVGVPSSIDATGSTNAGPALQAFINSQPDGTQVNFPATAVYRLDRGLYLSGRHQLVFEGNGATLRATGAGNLIAASPIVIDGVNSDIVVRDFVIEGSNARTGTSIYDPSGESQEGVGIYGGARIEISNNTIRKAWGDAIYANEKDVTHTWLDGLWVHDNAIASVGRNAFTMNGVKNAVLESNTVDQIGGSVLDIEPDTAYQGATNVTLRNNSVGVWGLSPIYTQHFVACANNDYGPGAVVGGITITGNTVKQGAPNSATTPNAGGLFSWFGKTRTANVVFADNVTSWAGAGPVLRFEHVDGLTVTGNSQPVTSGPVVSVSDSTSVTVN
jgi:hypothetical protein